jgi:hypothetical protein
MRKTTRIRLFDVLKTKKISVKIIKHVLPYMDLYKNKPLPQRIYPRLHADNMTDIGCLMDM